MSGAVGVLGDKALSFSIMPNAPLHRDYLSNFLILPQSYERALDPSPFPLSLFFTHKHTLPFPRHPISSIQSIAITNSGVVRHRHHPPPNHRRKNSLHRRRRHSSPHYRRKHCIRRRRRHPPPNHPPNKFLLRRRHLIYVLYLVPFGRRFLRRQHHYRDILEYDDLRDDDYVWHSLPDGFDTVGVSAICSLGCNVA